MKSIALGFFFFCTIFLNAQTNYEGDSRSNNIQIVVKRSIALSQLCARYLKNSENNTMGFDSMLEAKMELDNILQEFAFNSRYRPLLGLCYSLYLDKVASMFELHGDSVLCQQLFLKQLDWLEETYNDEIYPITMDSDIPGQNMEFTMSWMYKPVSRGVRTTIEIAVKYNDPKTVLRASKLFLVRGLRGDVDVRRYVYAAGYRALVILNSSLTEKLDWMRKTMVYFRSTSSTNWQWNDWDLSLEFYNLLGELKRAGNKNSLEDMKLCATALRDKGHIQEADKVYQEMLSEQGLLDFDLTIDIFDFYRNQGNNEEAKHALKRVNVPLLGCVDLMVIAAKYKILGDKEMAKEFDNRYEKCMRDHKRYGRRQNRQEFAKNFDWIPDFWNEKMNLAISVNPIAGLNTKMGSGGGGGAPIKYLPMSADLRTGSFIHEFRWNRFFDHNSGDRFTNGNLGKIEIENEIRNDWISLKGNDYSYFLGIVAHRTEDESYRERWKGFHSFGVQYLWGNFRTSEETTSVLFKGNVNLQDLRIIPTITRKEWLFQWKYSRFYNKWFYYTLFMGVGVGERSINYNSPDAGILEVQLKNTQETTFYDARLVQSNWIGPKLTMRAGFRIGITLK